MVLKLRELRFLVVYRICPPTVTADLQAVGERELFYSMRYVTAVRTIVELDRSSAHVVGFGVTANPKVYPSQLF